MPSLEEIVKEYQRPVYFFVRRLIKSHEDAADITQQVFIQVHRNIKQLKIQANLRAWLYRIAQNLCYSHWRQQKKYTAVDIEAADHLLIDRRTPEEEVRKNQQQQLVREAVSALPYKQRVTLTLRVYEQMSYREIGQVLDCSENTAKVNYQHALNQLKTVLGENL
ncbi:MAG: sigma-70 family RNA polymerase sigma factor [Candidatus Schekmanbacteria bacterium]|nr:sigma-70 family RNA polymerase sigma factor [Candidatus Schekmanbacteria bacterium]